MQNAGIVNSSEVEKPYGLRLDGGKMQIIFNIPGVEKAVGIPDQGKKKPKGGRESIFSIEFIWNGKAS